MAVAPGRLVQTVQVQMEVWSSAEGAARMAAALEQPLADQAVMAHPEPGAAQHTAGMLRQGQAAAAVARIVAAAPPAVMVHWTISMAMESMAQVAAVVAALPGKAAIVREVLGATVPVRGSPQ